MTYYHSAGTGRVTRDSKENAAHSPGTRVFRAGLIPCLTLLLNASCATNQKYEPLGEVKTSFSYDDEFLKKRGVEGGDTGEFKKKILGAGWEKDEDGKFVAKNPDMYSGREYGKGRDIKKKDLYLSKRDADTKYFKTPEYLERQNFATKSASEGDSHAREGLFDKNRATESGRSARTKAKPGFLASLNPFKTSTAGESGSYFRTSNDRIGAKGQKNAARATGVSQSEIGFYNDSVNTMDDVKKLLHPEAFH